MTLCRELALEDAVDLSIITELFNLGTLRPIYRTGVKLPSRCPILYLLNKYPY